MNKFTRLFGLTLVLVLMFSVIGAASAQDVKILRTGVDMVGGDVPTLDPSQIQTSQSIAIANQMFIGVTFQDELTSEYVPAMAESWTVDGTVYTFNLRQDVPWVRYNADTGEVEQVVDENGNVRMVNANDFVYGIQRSLDPVTAAPYAYILLDYIVGATEYSTGESTDFSTVGVRAVDDYTLEITSPEEGVAFITSIYGMWVAYAQPAWTIEENGDLWTEPEYINTYGPFALKEWAHDESVTLVKNPFWPGTEVLPSPAIDEIYFAFLDQQTQLASYEAGELDAVELPVEELDRVKADPALSQEYVTGTNPCTYYIGFDLVDESPISQSNSLRRALSLAIDRQSIIDNVIKGGQLPAQWFTRPGLNAAPTLETHPDLGVKFDAEAAQAELATALEELGVASAADISGLVLSYNDSSGHAAIMQAVQQMWADTLGVQAQLAALEPSTYFSNLREDATMMYRAGWCQDYSDANNFAYDVFRSTATFNYPGFNNAEYDALVDEARTLTDVEARRELYAQAEEILVMDDVAIVPIYWYTENNAIKPYVEPSISIVGQQNYSRWDISN